MSGAFAASSGMGLRSLLQCSGNATVINVDQDTAASAPFCYCHLSDADAAATNCFVERPLSSSPNNNHNTAANACRCGEWPVARLTWHWDAQRRHPEARIAEPNAEGQVVVFHPVYSAGTAVVRSDRPLAGGEINYFEVKVLSALTGTDTMIGIGDRHVSLDPPVHQFLSYLGADKHSWGFSYRGTIQHAGQQRSYSRRRFGIGCLVGVLVDLHNGRLEFYLNRKSLGIAYTNIPQSTAENPLYAFVSSTAVKSAVKLIHCNHHPYDLQYQTLREASKSPATMRHVLSMPGLRFLCNELFYMHAPERYAYAEHGHEDRRPLDEVAANVDAERAFARPRPKQMLRIAYGDDDDEACVYDYDETAVWDADGMDIYADLVTTPIGEDAVATEGDDSR